MDEQKIREIEEEVNELLEKVREDEEVMNTPLPDGLEKNIKKRIRAIEVEKMEHAIDEELAKADELADVVEFPREAMSAEDEEWIRLGKIYKKKQKSRKYYVAAAVAIFVLALGVTSIGGPEKVFETFKRYALGREQVRVNSGDDVELVDNISEEEVYQKIEEEFGFVPVRMHVLPDNVGFLEASIGEEIQGINLIYGTKEKVKLSYFMRPNYREGSYSTDMEDQVIDEYSIETESVLIMVKQYCVEQKNNHRWSAEFTYQDVSYYIVAMDMEKENFEKIVKNLFFS